MNLLFAVSASEFFQAFCWMLVHSLWQGLVAGLLAGLVIFFTRRSPANTRYKLMLSVLSLFLLSAAITFVLQLKQSTVQDGEQTSAIQVIAQQGILNTDVENHPAEKIEAPFSYSFTTYLNDHALPIVFIWFIFFLLKSVQLFAGLHYIHRIRYKSNEPVSPYWENILDRFAKQVGVKRSVLFLQSSLVKVPVVIGMLKPVILVPIGLLNNLPAEQVEAVLLHELAHIRRNDFLVNLLQSFAEVIFFFNPAIVWLSNYIREEREACCDDIVLKHTSGRESYLEALVYFQEYSLQGYAMAFTGKKNYLLNRVKRMLTQENKKLNTMEKILLLSGLAITMAFGVISKDEVTIPVSTPLIIKPNVVQEQAIAIRKPNEKKVHSQFLLKHDAPTDTVPPPKKQQAQENTYTNISTNTNDDGTTRTSVTESIDKQGKKYRIKKVNGEIREFSVNGVLVPKDHYDDYASVIEGIESAQQIREAKAREEKEMRKMRMQQQQLKFEQDREVMTQQLHRQKLRMDSTIRDMREKQELLQREQREELRMQKDSLHRQSRLFAEKKNSFLTQSDRRSSNDEISRLLADLKRDKLITNEQDCFFTLNDVVLTVNDKEAPEAVYQRYKEKYLHKQGDSITYERVGNSVTQTIRRN
jgi:bla regulator protein BlaR1